jgi:hypothetical protein
VPQIQYASPQQKKFNPVPPNETVNNNQTLLTNRDVQLDMRQSITSQNMQSIEVNLKDPLSMSLDKKKRVTSRDLRV